MCTLSPAKLPSKFSLPVSLQSSASDYPKSKRPTAGLVFQRRHNRGVGEWQMIAESDGKMTVW
jgi:hypothetical protein